MLALTKKGVELFQMSDQRTVRLRYGISKAQLTALAASLEEHGYVIAGSEVVDIPADGMNKARGQYRSKYLLGKGREMAKGQSDWHAKVLVITDADIYSTGTHYVVGQAELDGRAAVVSITRIRSGDEPMFMRRLVTEALHELGHTIGLRHCRDKGCVMFSSKKLPDSDIKSHEYCKRCRVRIGRALGPG